MREPDPRDPRAVPAVAARQAGVFTRQQALAEGWTPRQVQRRMAARRWVRVAGSGLALAAPGRTAFQLASAAWLTWPDCVVSHRTAAVLHGLPVSAGGDAHVISHRGRRSARAIEVHVLPLGDDEMVQASGGRATTLVRTVTDCLRTFDRDDALDLYAWVSSRELVDRETLHRLADRDLGRHGSPALREVLRRTATGAVSEAELKLHALLDDAGISGWVAGARVSDRAGVIGVVDLLFEAERVVVEVDGWRAHSSREAFARDRLRQNRLVQAEYQVLRYTWDDLVHRPQKVIADIRQALARARSRAATGA